MRGERAFRRGFQVVQTLFPPLWHGDATRDDASPQRRPAAAAAAARRGGSGPTGGRPGPGLPGPARRGPGADVRTPVRGRDERLPSRSAAGAPRQTQPDVPELRPDPGRQEGPPPGQPAQHLPLGLQAELRAQPLPALHPRGLLPLPGLSAGAAGGGERAAPQHPRLRPVRHPEEERLLRRRPPLLHGDLRVHRRGVHLCAAAGKEAGRQEPHPEPGQSGAEARREGLKGVEARCAATRNMVFRATFTTQIH